MSIMSKFLCFKFKFSAHLINNTREAVLRFVLWLNIGVHAGFHFGVDTGAQAVLWLDIGKGGGAFEHCKY